MKKILLLLQILVLVSFVVGFSAQVTTIFDNQVIYNVSMVEGTNTSAFLSVPKSSYLDNTSFLLTPSNISDIEWVLIDDFNNPIINASLWELYGETTNYTIKNSWLNLTMHQSTAGAGNIGIVARLNNNNSFSNKSVYRANCYFQDDGLGSSNLNVIGIGAPTVTFPSGIGRMGGWSISANLAAPGLQLYKNAGGLLASSNNDVLHPTFHNYTFIRGSYGIEVYQDENLTLFLGDNTFDKNRTISLFMGASVSGGAGHSTVCDNVWGGELRQPENLTIYLNETLVYNHTGTLRNATTISLPVDLANNILNDNCTCTNCTVTGTSCNLPFIFNSEENGSMKVENSNVSYTFGINNCTQAEFPGISNGTALNFSFFHPNGNPVNVFFDTTINFGLTTTKVTNYSTFGWGSDFDICIYPSWANLYSDIFLDYDNFSYNTLNTILNNVTKQISLNTQLQTSEVTFTVLDRDTREVENAFIHILKWDPGTNSYSTTEILRTDALGEAVGQIELSTTYYRFIITLNGDTKLVDPTTGGIKLYTNTRTFTISTSDTQWYDDYDEMLNIEAEMIFNNVSNSFVFTFTNPTGNQVKGCMKVTQGNQTGLTTLSDSCTTSSSASIVKAITPTNCSTFTATGYFFFGNNQYVPNIQNNPLGEIYACDFSLYGQKGDSGNKEVLFLAWLIVAALMFIGLPFPELSMILAIVGMIIVVAVGMWQVSWMFITPLIVIGLIYMIKGNRK